MLASESSDAVKSVAWRSLTASGGGLDVLLLLGRATLDWGGTTGSLGAATVGFAFARVRVDDVVNRDAGLAR